MENLNKIINDCRNALKSIERSVNVANNELDCLFSEVNEISQIDEIIKQIDSMPTDDVAKIYYAIENSHHFSHLDKFKML